MCLYLIVAGFACNLTQVATLQLGYCGSPGTGTHSSPSTS